MQIKLHEIQTSLPIVKFYWNTWFTYYLSEKFADPCFRHWIYTSKQVKTNHAFKEVTFWLGDPNK